MSKCCVEKGEQLPGKDFFFVFRNSSSHGKGIAVGSRKHPVGPMGGTRKAPTEWPLEREENLGRGRRQF